MESYKFCSSTITLLASKIPRFRFVAMDDLGVFIYSASSSYVSCYFMLEHFEELNIVKLIIRIKSILLCKLNKNLSTSFLGVEIILFCSLSHFFSNKRFYGNNMMLSSAYILSFLLSTCEILHRYVIVVNIIIVILYLMITI